MVPSCFCQPFLWSPTVTNSSRLPTTPRHLLKRSDATKPSWNQDSWQSWSLEKKFRASTQMMSRASLKRSTKLSISSRPSLSTWSVSSLTYARRIVRRDYERKFWAGLKINSISEAWPMCIPLYISLSGEQNCKIFRKVELLNTKQYFRLGSNIGDWNTIKKIVITKKIFAYTTFKLVMLSF